MGYTALTELYYKLYIRLYVYKLSDCSIKSSYKGTVVTVINIHQCSSISAVVRDGDEQL